MSESHGSGVVKWWTALAVGTTVALLIAWLAHVAGVDLSQLLSVVAGAGALGWLIVLVSVPWNLYFGARQVLAGIEASRRRDIHVEPGDEAEARRIQRRMLGFALGGHVVTALGAGLIGYLAKETAGYYFMGFYLLSAAIRPAVAYFSHLRNRIGELTRETSYPRDDVVTLRSNVDDLTATVKRLEEELPQATTQLAARLTGDLTHAQQRLVSDLARLEDAQATDRQAARERADELGRKVDRITRQIETTLDGLSDHQELQAGLRALVRMIRADAAT
jgi:polyhydroxyalkanoate synthesis regulator phasin